MKTQTAYPRRQAHTTSNQQLWVIRETYRVNAFLPTRSTGGIHQYMVPNMVKPVDQLQKNLSNKVKVWVMCQYTPITSWKGLGISFDPPPAHNSNNNTYIVNNTKQQQQQQQGKVANRPLHRKRFIIGICGE